MRTIKTAAGVAGLLAGALVMVPGAVNAVPQVPAGAGSIEVWGATSVNPDAEPVRANYALEEGPWAAIAVGTAGTDYAITSAGVLERLSGTSAFMDIPTELATADVKAVSTVGNKAAAALADGSFQLWGDARNLSARTMTPAELGGNAIDVAVGSGNFVVIQLDNGKVGMLTTSFGYEIVTQDGNDLTGVAEIASNVSEGYARLQSGGVVPFSIAGSTPPPAIVNGESLADKVVSIDSKPGAGKVVAATESGKVYVWDPASGELLSEVWAFPADEVTGKVVEVAASSAYFAARTNTNEVVVWGQLENSNGYTYMTDVPEEVEGHRVADLVGGAFTFAAIVSGPLPPMTVQTTPTIAGSATVGATLTGTPATFAGEPEEVTNRWLANGEPIEGATNTTYTLTNGELGDNITFESTATRDEDEPVVSVSDPVGPVVDAPVVAAPSSTQVSAPARTYGSAGTVTVTVGNTAGRPVAGTVTLSGAGAAQTAAVVGGQATFALDRALAAGSYTLTAAYSGSADLTASAGAAGFSVAKGKSGKPAFKANKASTSKKKGKATVTIGSSSGLAKATGKATVTIKKGRTTKKINVTLSNGKKSISLPKLKKGTWKVQVSYNGDKNYVAQKSKSYNLKIKK